VTGRVLRVFVTPGSCDEGWLTLGGKEADRLYLRGARSGDRLVALDDSGWEMTIAIEHATPESIGGKVVERQVASERRTKISLYHGLLHPSDFRRLLAGATGLGVVAFVPVITDLSIIPVLGDDGRTAGEGEWPRLVRDAAESSGRGRCPTVGQPMLLSHALDKALRSGTVLMVGDGGASLEEALSGRPFSIDLFCPPPAGFSIEERSLAAARDVTTIHSAASGPDPVQPVLATLEAMYAGLEDYAAKA
jgi:16S rRNA (uracil1498-N3)-methyltransferase